MFCSILEAHTTLITAQEGKCNDQAHFTGEETEALSLSNLHMVTSV